MKNIIKFLLLSIVCITTTCLQKDSENCHYSIKFTNNSEQILYVNEHPDLYPDPFDIRNLSYFTPTQKDIKCCEEKRISYMRSCIENAYNHGRIDTLFVYIFNAEVVENMPWEIVARDYLVLKRYDLTLDDLQWLDWKITYPPTEAMKDVKMYPPYGSE